MKVKKFEKDPRIVIARTIDDFSLIGHLGIKGAILKNPNTISPHEHESVIQAVTANECAFNIKMTDVAVMPEYIRKTAGFLQEAYTKASRRPNFQYIDVRRNIEYPIIPHSHTFVAIADIIGKTTVGYAEDDINKPYDFPSGSIIAFENILHRSPVLQNPLRVKTSPIRAIERLTMIF